MAYVCVFSYQSSLELKSFFSSGKFHLLFNYDLSSPVPFSPGTHGICKFSLLGLFHSPIFHQIICISKFLFQVLRYFIYLIFRTCFGVLAVAILFFELSTEKFSTTFSSAGKSFVFELHTYLLQGILFSGVYFLHQHTALWLVCILLASRPKN